LAQYTGSGRFNDALGALATRLTHAGLSVHIHIGQAVLFYGGSVEYFRDMVFNYPTLAEAYKVAALDGLNKL
jgi:NAD(P) transhydrogenase